MSNTAEKQIVKNDMVIRVKVKKTPGCKAGAEPNDKMQFITVEVDEQATETNESIELSIHIQSNVKPTKVDKQ